MKKFVVTTLLILFFMMLVLALFSNSNNPDIVIVQNPVYKSHQSIKYKSPILVEYKLFKGGGYCSRASMKFKVDQPEIPQAHGEDYFLSGWDVGHCCNAEDESDDCKKEELTFRFYNAMPQSPNLNRGLWKHYEKLTRELSQNDSLMIYVGGFYGSNWIGKNHVGVPDTCFRVVQRIRDGQIVFSLGFTNSRINNQVFNLDVSAIEKRIGINFVK